MFGAILLIQTLVWARACSAAVTAGDFGRISLRRLKGADVVCAGKVAATRQLDGVAPWWGGYRSLTGLVASEADFRIDSVVRGPVELEATQIAVRYPGSRAKTGPITPDFANSVGRRRCLICVMKGGPWGDTYGFESDNGAFAPVGDRPARLGKASTEAERLAAEMATSIRCPDWRVAWVTMRYVPYLGVCNARSVKEAVLERIVNRDDVLAPTAASVLIRSGDIGELYAVSDQMVAWRGKGNANGVIGDAVSEVRGTKAIPALVKLLQRPERGVRAGVAYALRDIRSGQCVSALVGALDDADEMVRYNAVVALAYQTDHMKPGGWAPALTVFRQNPQAHVRKWKEWWEQHGVRQYPPVEAVLSEYERTKAELASQGKLPVWRRTAGGAPVPAGVGAATPQETQTAVPPERVGVSGRVWLVSVLCAVLGLCAWAALRARRRARHRGAPE